MATAKPRSPRTQPMSSTMGFNVNPMAWRAPPLMKRTRNAAARIMKGLREEMDGIGDALGWKGADV